MRKKNFITEVPLLIPPKKFELIHGDCMDRLYDVEEKSVDMILCDLPYGTTQCKWDTCLDLDLLWKHYKAIIKDNGAIVLFGAQPFTSALVMSNLKWFRYEWIWVKNRGTGFLNAKKQPLRNVENILVFYKKQAIYNPQMTPGEPYLAKGRSGSSIYSTYGSTRTENISGDRYPKQAQFFASEMRKAERGNHPTQKPVALCEYLIKTYTNEGDLVLDNCMGSGTTGVAARNLNRNFIGMEKDEVYFELAKKRIGNG